MSSSSSAVYKGAANPPRSAKEVRKSPNAFILPREPDSSPEPSQSRQRTAGRKPATMSRAAREAQRKLNHSAIEKARRTKINDALARLKELVPPNFGRDPKEILDEQDIKASQKGEDKEFKLDILVKTVGFMEHLLDRISTLESQAQQSSSLKRKATEESTSHVSKSRRTNAEGNRDPVMSPTSLPSFSTLLDNIDPCLLTSPRITADPSHYLPSPPSSGQLDTMKRFHLSPPELSLDAPSTPFQNADDESAASLLLHIKSSSPSTSSIKALVPQTPSSILGILRK